MITGNHMPFHRLSVELPSKPLLEVGIVPRGFFRHNSSVEVLRVYSFQPRERVLLVRVVRPGLPRSEAQIRRDRAKLRRRYHLRDFEILDVEARGHGYVALLRQSNPGVLEDMLEDLGAGVTPTTPTVIRRDTATLSFVADEASERMVLRLLDGLGVPWRLTSRRRERATLPGVAEGLTGRQRELLDLAWKLGYFDIPARVGLAKLADLTGLSRNTVSQHLRRALRRMLRGSLG